MPQGSAVVAPAMAMMGPVEMDAEASGAAADSDGDGNGDDGLSSLSRRQLLRLVARAPDSYGLVLILLVIDYVLITVDWSGGVSLFVRSALFLLTLLLAFRTSRVSPRIQKIVRVLAALTIVAAFVVAIAGEDRAIGAVTLLTSVLLLATPVAIGWRILHHERVTGETIAGAICIYVLIGMIFANLDYGIQLASGNDFFAQSGHHGLPDFAYFSYITMATVGYGDLTPTTGLPRTMSVLDALVGQVFLVVLLARLVSMYRGPAGLRRGLEERLTGQAGLPSTQPAPPADS
jgi:ion channel